MDPWVVAALWLHTVAFVIAWGYYGILGRFVIPALARALGPEGQVAALVEIERRALPFLALAVVIFTLTGTYLLVADDRYEGLGNVGTLWAQLLLAKHVLVLLLLALGAAVGMLVRAAGAASSETARSVALRRVRLAAEAATALGALVALTTAAMQVA